MRMSVLTAAQSGGSSWSVMDHITPQELADLWANGSTVCACVSEHAGKVSAIRFQSAEAVMVRIKLAHLPLETALNASFTQQYATVAAYSGHEGTNGELLLAFELPEPISDGRSYVRLLAGLETLYAGAIPHTSAEEYFGLAAGTGKAEVLGRKLDQEAVRTLDRLGLETKELRKGRGAYLRSHVTLDKGMVVKIPGGEEYPLERLPKELEIFCPIHVGAVPTGVVHWYADGTPGIQCTHCKRTFAAPTTQRTYDFSLFDRTIKRLAADVNKSIVTASGLAFDADDVSYQTERYLPTIELKPGVTFVKSPKGTGKTEALANLVAQCKQRRLRVLLLGHRRALLQSISNRLGLDCYFVAEDGSPVPEAKVQDGSGLLGFDEDTDSPPPMPEPLSVVVSEGKEARYQRVAPTMHYAICLDSMQELDPEDGKRRYDVVIIDEAEQVFAHLTGDTLKGRRREVFARLSYYLRMAPHVVLLDADLGMVTMATAFEVFKPNTTARFIINEPKAAQGDIHVYSNRGQLAQMLVDRVAAGSRVFVATNSKRKAVELGKVLGDRCPGARVAVVTSDNAQQRDVQELLGDIVAKFERNLDVLIASPAIGTGIDITFKDQDGNPRKVVDCVFGFFEANIVTHFDIDQQLMRVRHPGEVHVWIDPIGLNYETDVTCIKRELEKTVRRTSYLLRYEDDGQPVFAGDEGLVNIWAQVLAAARGSKNRLSDLFKTLRVEGGWTPVTVEYDGEAAELGKAAMAKAKAMRQAERMNNLLTAERLSADEAQRLEERDERGLPLTDLERNALERYRIESFYADGDITAELIDFDDEGRTRQSVQRLECLTSKREWFEIRDDEDLDSKVLAFDRRRYLVQREVLEAVFVAAGLLDASTRKFKVDVTVEAESLKGFLHALESKRRQIEALFSLPLYADCWRKPVVQLKGILGLVGLDLELRGTEQKQGKKIRRYGIPAAMLDSMAHVVKRRDAKYKRDTAERPQRDRDEDKLPRVSVNKLAAAVSYCKARKAGASGVPTGEKAAAKMATDSKGAGHGYAGLDPMNLPFQV